MRFVSTLAAVVGLTLVIACLNTANLSMVRSTERGGDMAVRSALGASRGRLLSQVLIEHILLTGMAGAAAIAVGLATMRLLSAYTLPGGISLANVPFSIGGRVLGATGVLVLFTGFTIGFGPARHAAEASLTTHGSRRVTKRVRGQAALIVGQMALTVVLLVGALLFVRSLRHALETDLGFDPSAVGAVSVDLFRYGYDGTRARLFYDEALRRSAALPDVDAVALATHVPLSTVGMLGFDTPGGPYTRERPLRAGVSDVTEGYFGVMALPIVAGRGFSPDDDPGAPRVVVLNEIAARSLFPGGSAVGGEVRVFGQLPAVVVGVVGDSKYGSIAEEGVPMVYQSALQNVRTVNVTLVVRSQHAAAVLPALRTVIQGIDPTVAPHNTRLLSEQVDRVLAPQHLGSLLLSLLAAIALCVAAVGIYAIVASSVSQRTAEIGIRIALGASGHSVLRVVVGRTGVAIAVGAILGQVAAFAAGRAIERFLFGVGPVDPVSVCGATGLLVSVAVIAILRPARRALSTDPQAILRGE